MRSLTLEEPGCRLKVYAKRNWKVIIITITKIFALSPRITHKIRNKGCNLPHLVFATITTLLHYWKKSQSCNNSFTYTNVGHPFALGNPDWILRRGRKSWSIHSASWEGQTFFCKIILKRRQKVKSVWNLLPVDFVVLWQNDSISNAAAFEIETISASDGLWKNLPVCYIFSVTVAL